MARRSLVGVLLFALLACSHGVDASNKLAAAHSSMAHHRLNDLVAHLNQEVSLLEEKLATRQFGAIGKLTGLVKGIGSIDWKGIPAKLSPIMSALKVRPDVGLKITMAVLIGFVNGMSKGVLNNNIDAVNSCSNTVEGQEIVESISTGFQALSQHMANVAKGGLASAGVLAIGGKIKTMVVDIGKAILKILSLTYKFITSCPQLRSFWKKALKMVFIACVVVSAYAAVGGAVNTVAMVVNVTSSIKYLVEVMKKFSDAAAKAIKNPADTDSSVECIQHLSEMSGAIVASMYLGITSAALGAISMSKLDEPFKTFATQLGLTDKNIKERMSKTTELLKAIEQGKADDAKKILLEPDEDDEVTPAPEQIKNTQDESGSDEPRPPPKSEPESRDIMPQKKKPRKLESQQQQRE